ncbi:MULTISPECIES: LysR family transcriptional regulator [Shewanella]|uniref:LysR family transcriptional regulator n=1 Tax=Shewanella japonica TaxID=93973 RepID=A0ABM6JFT5_9GAMM|nr:MULTISPECIES: LysR family transcriptional regulator [Shewanella]ARD20890.1 LysR family transcriptional regulator [Shewanella japonica]KPZ73179.1 HTH-type transcriptional regulator CynR [Shewanella sp. P1-14-1]MBQ4890737.1 LysR family transcriptional regulator [Shewanella sp. MMG014]OBT06795.1 LysR family transcriptional regulator [Shewanella sp. UCD-FRSSP16_17]
MNLKQLEIFCAIADTGSVTAAAKQLNSNRTQLSMAMKALETSLSAKLFVRSGNSLVLSEVGKSIYKDCESVVATCERIQQTCEQTIDKFRSEIWLARDDSFPDEVWQTFIIELNNHFTATTVNTVLASSGDLANLVNTGQVDFAFGVDFERVDDANTDYLPLGRIRMMSVCEHTHPLASLKRVSDSQLRESLQAVMVYLNDKDNPELQPFSLRHIGFSSFEYMLNTIMSEKAWGVLPEPLIRPHLRNQKLAVIKHTYGLTHEDYCMFSMPGSAQPESVAWLCDQISDYLFKF